MSEPLYLALGISIAAVITFLLRAVPFLITERIGQSDLLTDLGRWMPLGAISILMMYCLFEIDLGDEHHGVPELAGIVATVAVHLWRRNAVLSIVAGSGTCLVLANLVLG